ncbi:MAG: membrane protein [Saprospiraceae bacterium]|nr:MAG: membrane protein [Saprospiraceae bacterium]
MLLFFKALHIVGFVAWFAGLFYLVRIFVYHVEAMDKSQPERDILVHQFQQMEWRVYKIIINPAMMITWVAGLIMLYLHGLEWLKVNYWMHAKLPLLFLLIGYQLWCKRLIVRLEKGEKALTSFQFRLANELPTLFLLTIVLLAVFRNSLNFFYAFFGILGFGFALFLAAKAYKQFREKA